MLLFRIPPKILNIMGIDTLRSIMISGNRAPDSFIHIKEEFEIPRQFVNQIDCYFLIIVSKGAQLVEWA